VRESTVTTNSTLLNCFVWLKFPFVGTYGLEGETVNLWVRREVVSELGECERRDAVTHPILKTYGTLYTIGIGDLYCPIILWFLRTSTPKPEHHPSDSDRFLFSTRPIMQQNMRRHNPSSLLDVAGSVTCVVFSWDSAMVWDWDFVTCWK